MKQWEIQATRELSAIIYELSYQQYESKEALANRLRAAADEIEKITTPDYQETYIGKLRRNRRHEHPLHLIRQDDGSETRTKTCDACNEYNADQATILQSSRSANAALKGEPQRNQIFMSIDGSYLSVRIHCTSETRAAELYYNLEKFLVEVERQDRQGELEIDEL